jgi:hypothetical protein
MVHVETVSALKHKPGLVFREYWTGTVEFGDVKSHGFGARRGGCDLGRIMCEDGYEGGKGLKVELRGVMG